MPEQQLFFTDGASLKNITLPQYPNSAWTWFSNEPSDETADFYASVAAVYRVANLSADAVASMPFVVLNQRDDEVDTSDDYQNVAGIIRNPKEILRLWRLSLFMTNRAYGFITGTRRNRALRYIAPDTITRIMVDQVEGIVGFERTIGSPPVVTQYPVFENPLDNQIFWMFRRDHTTELLPSPNTEFKALMNAAGVLYYSDEHLKNFYERGGIKPTLLKVNGVPTREEREKIENWWDKVMRGVYKFLGKVIVADTMETETIGEGAESWKDTDLHREKLEDVAIAAGMPLSLLLSNSANYATATVEYANWFNNSVIPWAEFMEDCMNQLLFEPLGLRFNFRPEITNMGTQEEHERAGAYAALVASNIMPSVAAQMLGYELPPDYTDYTQLDTDYFDMLKLKSEITSVANAAVPGIEMPEIEEPKPPKPNVVPDVDRAPVPKATLLTIDQLRELELWQDIAFRKLKRGDDMDFPFVCKELPEHVATDIRAVLPACKTQRDVERAFNMEAPKRDDAGLKELAEALNRAVQATVEIDIIEEV